MLLLSKMSALGIKKEFLPSVLLYFLFLLPLFVSVQIAEYDESIYLNVARSISETGIANRPLGDGILYAEHTSLYQHLIGLQHRFIGDQIFWFRLLTSLCGVVVLWLVWSIVEQKVGLHGALVASLITAVNPFFLRYAYFIREEVWLCLFILLAVRSLLKDQQTPNEQRHIYLFSLWSMLAFLTKELSLIFSAIAIIYLFLTGKNGRDRLFRAVLPTCAILIGFALWSLWIFAIDPLRFRSIYARWFDSIVGGSGGSALNFPEAAAWLRLISTTLLSPTLVLLLCLGLGTLLYRSIRERKFDRFSWFVTLYPFIAVTVSLMISLKRDRHIMPIIFFTAIAIGITIDWDSVLARLRGNRLTQGVGVLLAIFILFEISPLQLAQGMQAPAQLWEEIYFQRLVINDRHYGVLQNAGLILGEQMNEGEIAYVVNEGPVIGYYADRNYQFLYTQDYNQVMTNLDRATWLVVDSETFPKLTEDQKRDVFDVIDCHFDVFQQVSDQFRQLEILQRNEPGSLETCVSD